MVQLQAIRPALLTVVLMSVALTTKDIKGRQFPESTGSLDPQAGSTGLLVALGASDLLCLLVAAVIWAASASPVCPFDSQIQIRVQLVATYWPPLGKRAVGDSVGDSSFCPLWVVNVD